MADTGAPIPTPTSSAQQRAWDAGVAAAPEEVADGVWAIASPIPEGPLPATLTYAAVSPNGSVHLIDPGWGGEAALQHLEHSLGQIGRSLDAVETVVATHFHPDHLGLCALIRERVNARVVLSATERAVLAHETSATTTDGDDVPARLAAWGVPDWRRGELLASFNRSAEVDDLEPDQTIVHGERLELPGHHLDVMQTPGHTDGHVCLADRNRRLLYSGDHVLPRIYAGIGLGTLPGSDPLSEYLNSLERLADVDDFEVLPGHEYRFSGLAERRRAIRDHHLRRTREVAALTASLGAAPVWEYARRLTWTAGWDAMRDFWLHSAVRQTELHLQFVQSGRADRWISAVDERST